MREEIDYPHLSQNLHSHFSFLHSVPLRELSYYLLVLHITNLCFYLKYLICIIPLDCFSQIPFLLPFYMFYQYLFIFDFLYLLNNIKKKLFIFTFKLLISSHIIVLNHNEITLTP